MTWLHLWPSWELKNSKFFKRSWKREKRNWKESQSPRRRRRRRGGGKIRVHLRVKAVRTAPQILQRATERKRRRRSTKSTGNPNTRNPRSKIHNYWYWKGDVLCVSLLVLCWIKLPILVFYDSGSGFPWEIFVTPYGHHPPSPERPPSLIPVCNRIKIVIKRKNSSFRASRQLY